MTLSTAHKKGQLEKYIQVESNDPNQPNARLQIIAFAEIYFGFESYSLTMGNLLRGDSAGKVAWLIVKDTATTKIAEFKSSSEFISARALDSVLFVQETYKIPIEITIRPGLPAGQLRESVTLVSNLENKLESNLRIMGTIIGDIMAEPEVVNFNIYGGPDTIKNHITQQIAVYSRIEGKPLNVLNVQDSHNRLTMVLDTVSAGRRYAITATIKDEIIQSGGNYSGFIIIATDDPEQPEIKIRYQIANRSKTRR